MSTKFSTFDFARSHTLSHAKGDTLACWATAEGERKRLTFYREEKNGGGIGKEGKEKEKTRGYTIEQKEKW